MGEIADMMIDGTMCPCGSFINDGSDGPGYPQYCSPQCEKDFGYSDEPANPPKDAKTVSCPHVGCEKMFRSRSAAGQHWTDKHG